MLTTTRASTQPLQTAMGSGKPASKQQQASEQPLQTAMGSGKPARAKQNYRDYANYHHDYANYYYYYKDEANY